MYTFVVCMYACMYVYVCVCIHICMYIYIYICTHVQIRAGARNLEVLDAQVSIYACLLCTCVG
jgi:hypothetical protein